MPAETDNALDALTVVSPLLLGEDEKDQDRARWSPDCRVASVCDGVTSSPHSQVAAEMVTDLCPMLFGGAVQERLAGICDLLTLRRIVAQRSLPAIAADVPEAMREMLADIARQRMRSALQTTLVAASFTPTNDLTMADVVRCGDSAFLAFSGDGELLTSSPSWEPVGEAHSRRQSGAFRFGPGAELLVKVLGRASEPALRADLGPLGMERPNRWFVCSLLDVASQDGACTPHRIEQRSHWLKQGALLLVPEYLIGNAANSEDPRYQRVLYSSTIRPITKHAQPRAKDSFDRRSSVTEVLPDSFFAGRWVHFQECFPGDAEFVLASDGFYGAFDNPLELRAWLLANEAGLINAERRQLLMQDLHTHLYAKSGDDDMSFVWVRSKRPHPEQPSDETAGE